MDTQRFWIEVRRWRNYQYTWWLAWPVGAWCAIIAYRSAFGSQPPFELLVVLAALWFGVAVILYRRFSRLTCPRCRLPALQHSFFFMRHAKCQHCGLSYGDG